MVEQEPFDKWTLVHIAAGVLLGKMTRINPVWAIGGSILYELAEHEYQKDPANIFGSTEPESTVNAVTDVTVFIAAYFAGRSLR